MWSSPGGSAKAFRNDKITITWYTNKRSLLFQGQLGKILKAQILNLYTTESIVLDNNCNDVCEELPSSPLNQPLDGQHGAERECTEYRRLSVEMAQVKLDIEILRVTLDGYRESLIKLEGGMKKSAEEKREVGTQTSTFRLRFQLLQYRSHIFTIIANHSLNKYETKK